MKLQSWDPQEHSQETNLHGWAVKEKFAFQNGRRIVIELNIRPAGEDVPVGGITARLLRMVKLGQFAGELRQILTEYMGSSATSRFFDAMAWSRQPLRRKKRTRQVRANDRFYAELAQQYVVKAVGGKNATKPTQALAKLYGVTPAKMRSWIHLARANDFLTDTQRGLVGGELTPKAQQVLARTATIDTKKGQ